jgi:hypothetical protein
MRELFSCDDGLKVQYAAGGDFVCFFARRAGSGFARIDEPEGGGVQQREIVEAMNAFQKVLDSDPFNNAAHSFLVDTLASSRYQEAQSAPDPAQKLTGLDESAGLYRRLSVVDPANKLAYYFVGVIDWMKWYPAWMKARTSMGMKPEQAVRC